MDIDYDAESLELVELENEALREEVGRHRQNVARLVDMLTLIIYERDQLRRQITAKEKTSLVMRVGETSSLSQNNQQLYEQNRDLQDAGVRLAIRRNEPSPR